MCLKNSEDTLSYQANSVEVYGVDSDASIDFSKSSYNISYYDEQDGNVETDPGPGPYTVSLG
jgi:hypothetical protein